MAIPTSPAHETTPADLSIAARSVLAPLEAFRMKTARNLVQEKPAIDTFALNHAILSSILQVLFLSAGEKAGFAGTGTLALLTDSDGIGRRLSRACSDAGLNMDALFENYPAGRGPVPAVPDEALREVIRAVQSPEFPVPLSAMPLHELTAVFEQYLGTTMHIAEGYRVKREGKSVVKYTGSAHVTSQPVVEYMVRETLGSRSRIPGRYRGSAARILDPACGAGIFLLSAYRFLARQIAGQQSGPQYIKITQREVLSGSIFGTDIDPEAVAATRFVLLLAWIENCRISGSTPVTPGEVREISVCLRTTIRCGNTLIAPDYFSGRQVQPFNAGERQKVNAFDWQDGFPEILAAGGFDAMIGAPPPYRPFAIKDRDEYFQTHYDVYAQRAGLYGYFIERGVRLLRPEGTLVFCIPETFLRSHHARPLRKLLLSHQILEIADTGDVRSLEGEQTRIVIIRIEKSPVSRPFTVSMQGGKQAGIPAISHASRRFTIDQRFLGDGGWKLEDRRSAAIIDKLRHRGTPLDHYAMGEIESGTHRLRNNPLIVEEDTKNRLTGNEGRCRRFFVPLLRPADIGRYVPKKPGRYVISGTRIRDLRNCRALWKYLKSIAEKPDAGPGAEGAPDIAVTLPLPPSHDPVPFLNVPKIVFAPYQNCPAFTYDHNGEYALAGSLLAIPRNDPLLAAILNSSLGRFLITFICPLTDRGYHIGPAQLGKFPVITPDFDKLADRAQHDRMVTLVSQMLALHGYLQKARTDQERRLVQQEIEATDVKIDALVYELYGLTAEEIAVVEGA